LLLRLLGKIFGRRNDNEGPFNSRNPRRANGLIPLGVNLVLLKQGLFLIVLSYIMGLQVSCWVLVVSLILSLTITLNLPGNILLYLVQFLILYSPIIFINGFMRSSYYLSFNLLDLLLWGLIIRSHINFTYKYKF